MVARQAGHDVVGYTHQQADITQRSAIDSVVDDCDFVINCGAVADVDSCEQKPAHAHLVNAIAPGAIASRAREIGASIIHFSTDFVFDGLSGPYSPADLPNPLQAYGRQKLESEVLVREANPQCHLVRTSAVFGIGGKNFVSRLASARPPTLRVVAGHKRSHTFANDLADAAVGLCESTDFGVHHLANDGGATFGEVVNHVYSAFGEPVEILDVSTDDLNLVARRPEDSRLVPGAGGTRLRDWREAVDTFVAQAKSLNHESSQ